MKATGRYLELTYSDGRIVAGYLYLNRRPEDRVARSEERQAGLVVDFSADDRALGVEITAPTVVTLNDINAVLSSLGQTPLSTEELKPLRAA